MSRYQLRRIYASEAARVQNDRLSVISLDADCIKFGRNPEQVDVILNSMFYNNMISREHSEIRRVKGVDGSISYNLQDRSLNGTYVNDFRANGLVLLHAGDTIKFGHVNGAAVHPGVHAPQQGAEFTFIFEKVPRTGPQATSTVSGHSTTSDVSSAAMIPAMWGPTSTPATASGGGPTPFAYAQQLRLQAASSYPYQALNPYLTHQAYAAAFYQWPRQSQIVDQSSWMQQNGAAAAAAIASGGPSCALTSSSGGALRAPASSMAGSHGSVQQGPPTTPSFLPPYRLPHQAMFPTSAHPGGQQLNLPPTHLSSLQHQQAASVISQADVKRMECDSSVPSPPKSLSANVTSVAAMTPSTPGSLPSIKMDSKHSGDMGDAVLTQDLHALAASAAESSRRAFVDSPRSDKKESPNAIRIGDRSTPSSSSSSSPAPAPTRRRLSPPGHLASSGVRKQPRKSNEVARLLSDLTEGSWMHQAARKASAANAAAGGRTLQRASGSAQSPSTSAEHSDGSDDESDSALRAEKTKKMGKKTVARRTLNDSDSDMGSSSSSDGSFLSSPASRRAAANKKRGETDKSSKHSRRKASISGASTSRSKTKAVDSVSYASLSTPKMKTPKRSKPTAGSGGGATASRSGGKAKKRKAKRASWDSGSSGDESDAAGGGGVSDDGISEYAQPIAVAAPVAATSGVIDEWTYHDPEKLCDAKTKCRKPQTDNVNWVQCDDCESWYHTMCVDYDDALLLDDDAEYHCGCKKKSTKKKKRN